MQRLNQRWLSCALIALAAGSSASLAGVAVDQAPAGKHRDPGTGVSTTSYTAVDDWIPGDCDLDGDVDSDDGVIVGNNWMRTFADDEPAGPLHGDVNWDRQVNIDDLDIITLNASQSLSPIPPMDGVDLTTTLSSGQLSIIDNDLTAPNNVIKASTTIYRNTTASTNYRPPLYDDVADALTLAEDPNYDDHVAPLTESHGDISYSITTTDDGFDLEITVTNDYGDDLGRCLGGFYFDNFTFAGSYGTGSYRDFNDGGKEVTGDGAWSHDRYYPGIIYSPCQVLKVGDYTAGFSVQYPVLEYKHDFKFVTRELGTTHTWRFAAWPRENDYAVIIPAGETRVYTISLRIHKPSATCDTVNDWMRTIRPYRRYFRGLYGPVQYTRNPHPVQGWTFTQTSGGVNYCTYPIPGTYDINTENYYAFSSPSVRPDKYGYDGLIHGLSIANGDPVDFTGMDDVADKGWGRQMIWGAGGGTCKPIGQNCPPRFTSEIPNFVPAGKTADLSGYPVGNDSLGNPRILGLYWGNSCNYMSSWNASMVPFETGNPTHTAQAFVEMDDAYTVHDATEIGLDAFGFIPAWESFLWLQRLQSEYPGVKFITEGDHADLFHTIAPTHEIITFVPAGMGDPYNHYAQGTLIMDFLNPGHEFWGQIHPHALRKHLTGDTNPSPFDPDTDGVEAELQEFADLGFITVYHAAVPTLSSGDLEAAETWLTTVPADMQ